MNYYVFVLALLLHQALGDGSSQQVTRASNDFANKLYKKVSQKPGNVLVCPLSLHVALALLHQGAGGNTAAELSKVLGVNTDSREGYKNILSNIQMQNNILKVATKLYPAQEFQLDSNFVSNAQKYFLSEVEGINIHNPKEAAGKINKYVEDKTNNKIHDLISPEAITELTRLIIINAVHFQATWKKTFLPSYVDNFKVSPTKSVKTKMMSLTDYFGYKEDQALAAKVLKMDYEGGDYSMVFVLPNSDTGLPALEAKLATTTLENLLAGLYDNKVEVIIPKFKLEQTHNLKDTLASMGLSDMFSNSANLRNIAPTGDLHVSDVIQKTFINVHENGTEAAAATGITLGIRVSHQYIQTYSFKAKHPFVFYLIDGKNTGTVFNGRLVNPMNEN